MPELGFQTADLSNLFNANNNTQEQQPSTPKEAASEEKNELDSTFWDEFFNDGTWDATVVEKLQKIKKLLEDLKKIGLDSKKQRSQNQILSFIKIKWVQDELIKTELLNASTYIAVHNAIAKKYIAASEFKKANNYNILYCRDLYKKQPVTILKYFSLQSQVLPANASSYTEEMLKRNIEIFLLPKQKSVRQKDAALKTFEDIKNMSKTKGIAVGNNGNQDNNKNLNRQDLINIINKLSSVPQGQAALQFISITTNNAVAKEAYIKSLNYGTPSKEELISAMNRVAEVFRNANLTDPIAEELAENILETIRNSR